MRRTNLFHPLERGGLGLVNISAKLLVQRFLYFRDQRVPLLRAALQIHGAPFLMPWIVTSISIRQGGPPLLFYKEIARAVEFFTKRFSWDYLLVAKRKRLYWDTIDSLFPAPRYREPDMLKSDVLQRVRKMPVTTGVKNVFVMFHTETLPVKVWQQNKGFDVPWSLRCDHCHLHEETLRHAFLDCPGAIQYWAIIKGTLDDDMEMDWQRLKFLQFDDQGTGNPIDVIVAIAVYSWWLYRRDFARCEPQPRIPWKTFLRQLRWTGEALRGTDRPDQQYWEELTARLNLSETDESPATKTGRAWPRISKAATATST